jgi:DNA-binding transcriptional ArsR family regulator
VENLKQKMSVADQELAARFAKALSHPTRIEILVFLASQDSCFFGDIHDEFSIAKSTMSQHLKELRDAGLIKGEIETPKVRYCIHKENWETARRLLSNLFSLFDGKEVIC